MTFWTDKRILITGGAGFLGSHIIDNLVNMRGVSKSQIAIPRSKEADLRKWKTCKEVVNGVDIIIHLAARVGGIGFNQKYPGTLFYDNIMMGTQLMEAARLEKVISSFKLEQFVHIQNIFCSF